MPHRVIIETGPNGEPVRIVRRHSTSHPGGYGGHHHHHHHRPWDHERADITNEELASMKERERLLRETNENLTRQNYNLKTTLDATESDLRHHKAVVVQQQANIRELAIENGNLRRQLEGYQNIEERHNERTRGMTRDLRHKITRLENENESLKGKIRQLTREVRDTVDERVRTLMREVAEWKRTWEDLERRYTRMRANHDLLKEENAIYIRDNRELRRILRRHGHID